MHAQNPSHVGNISVENECAKRGKRRMPSSEYDIGKHRKRVSILREIATLQEFEAFLNEFQNVDGEL